MTASYRVLGTLLLLTATLVGVGVLQTGWAMTLGAGEAPRQAASSLTHPPGREAEILSRRITAKNDIVVGLRAGEMTLAEAAAWFGLLNAEPSDVPDRNLDRLPGKTRDEKLCRQVILWATVSAEADLGMDRAQDVACGLEGELATMIAQGEGKVTLPRR